jgi:hypothetical protein
VYEGEDRDWLLGLTWTTRTSIDATSLVTIDSTQSQSRVDGGLWTSDLGQRYLNRQREVIERGVRIRRVFIVERPEFRQDEDLDRVRRMHTDLGIEARTLYPERGWRRS